jgi:hypothetical protein
VITPVRWAKGSIYMGEGANIILDSGDNIVFGGVVSVGDTEEFTICGTPLRDVATGEPGEAAVVLAFTGDDPEPDEVTVASLVLSHDFDGEPVYALGRADGTQSLALARSYFEAADDAEEAGRYVRLLGVHGASDRVVPELVGILEGEDGATVRGEAAEWLARHARREGLSALDRAARHDRSPDVRREAVESLGELPDGRGREALIDLLEDPDELIRNEALEGLVEMKDGQGLEAARDLARSARSATTRRTAVEEIVPHMEPGPAVAWLRQLVADEDDVTVLNEIFETALELDDRHADRFVEEHARRGSDGRVRRAAAEALESRR